MPDRLYGTMAEAQAVAAKESQRAGRERLQRPKDGWTEDESRASTGSSLRLLTACFSKEQELQRHLRDDWAYSPGHSADLAKPC